MPEITVEQATKEVERAWREQGLSEQTVDKFGALLGRFARFAAAHGVTSLDEVNEHLAAQFVHARGHSRGGEVGDPAVATMQVRRSVVRAFYRTARAQNLTYADPARDIELPRREPSVTRPLTVSEADLVWLHAWDAGRPTRHAAVIALLLAGAQTGEVGHVSVDDLDLDQERVWVHGALKYAERWVPLDRRAALALAARRDRLLGANCALPTGALLLATGAGGSDAHKQARICVTVREVLRRAGLGDDPAIRPASVTAFAGKSLFTRSRNIEDAARVMGLRSLDAAASAIGYSWAERQR